MRSKSTLVVPAIALSLITLSACSSTGETATAPVSSANVATTTAATTTAATTAAAAATAADADYAPIPASPASTGASKDLDFGTLTKITTKDGAVTLHLNRSALYMGDEATTKNGGKAPLDGILIKDTDGNKEYTFTLDPKASIQAEGNLQDDRASTNERVDLTVDNFISNMTKLDALNDGKTDPDSTIHVYVWLRHTGGPNGPVTALSDQFIT